MKHDESHSATAKRHEVPNVQRVLIMTKYKHVFKQFEKKYTLKFEGALPEKPGNDREEWEAAFSSATNRLHLLVAGLPSELDKLKLCQMHRKRQIGRENERSRTDEVCVKKNAAVLSGASCGIPPAVLPPRGEVFSVALDRQILFYLRSLAAS